MGKRYEKEWIDSMLDGAERFAGTDPEETLSGIGVTAGSTVVDYGCGPGYFTLAAARLVGPSGRVYAVDLEPSMVSLVSTRAAEAGLANVSAVLSDGLSAPVSDAVADVIICVQIMHYHSRREDRVAIARDLSRMLKADGSVLIVQWKPKRPSSGVSYRSLASIMGAAGLVTNGAQSISSEQYRTLARKGHPGD